MLVTNDVPAASDNPKSEFRLTSCSDENVIAVDIFQKNIYIYKYVNSICGVSEFDFRLLK